MAGNRGDEGFTGSRLATRVQDNMYVYVLRKGKMTANKASVSGFLSPGSCNVLRNRRDQRMLNCPCMYECGRVLLVASDIL